MTRKDRWLRRSIEEHSVPHDERKLRSRASNARRASKEATKDGGATPAVAPADWLDPNLELPKREKLHRRRGESLERWVERLRGRDGASVSPLGDAELLEATGVVVAVTRGECEIELSGELVGCHLPKALLGVQAAELAVGDRLRVARRAGGTLVAASILPRTNRLSRPDPFLPHREKILAANLDLAVVVASLRKPTFSPGLVDRFLVALAHGGVPAALCVNKIDLAADPRATDPEVVAIDAYRRLGLPVVLASVRSEEGLEELRDLLAGKATVFVGASGVGKSSLVNALSPAAEAKTGEISASTRRGRHTTTRARTYRLAGGIRLIDTPGIREFGIWKMAPRELAGYFDEFEPAARSCRFADCTHTHEPDCAVRAAVEEGSIARARYEAYVRILASLADERR